VARSGSPIRRIASDWPLKPVTVIETIRVDAAALKAVLVIAFGLF